MDRSRRRLTSIFEVIGSTLAIAYALLVASNTGNEVLGFALLQVSSGLFALQAVLDRRRASLTLQFCYAVSAVIGLVRRYLPRCSELGRYATPNQLNMLRGRLVV